MISAQDTAALLQLDRQKTVDLERSHQDNLSSRQALAQVESRSVAVERELKKVQLEKDTLQKLNKELEGQRDWLLKRCPDDQVPLPRPAGLTPYRPRVYAMKSSPLEPEPPRREKEAAPWVPCLSA